MNDLFHYVTIGDIHIGKKSLTAIEQKHQLKMGIIKPLENIRFLDMIVIAGDIFDRKLSLNDTYSEVAMWFVSKLIKIAKKFNACIKIIQGTYSHDYEQLNMFNHLVEDGVFEIFNTVTINEYKGLSILFLPEEYVSDPNDYYSKYLLVPNEYYDLIFGHGTITEAEFFHKDSENMSTRAPLFNTLNLCRITKGQILFGHIHTHNFYYHKKVGYTGSALRLAHGEEESKGFIVSSYSKELEWFATSMYVNRYTSVFKTFTVTNQLLESRDPEEIIHEIGEFVNNYQVDKLRVIMKYISNSSISVKAQIIKKYLQNDKNITLEIKSMSEKAYNEEIINEQKTATEQKPYQRKGLTLEEKVQLWILHKKQKHVDLQKIKKYTG